MQCHTERDLRLWLAWFNLQWNRPDRTDNYLMQIACEIERTRLQDPNKSQPADKKLKFKKAVEKKELTTEQRIAISKGAWLAAAGRYRVVTKKPGEQ